MRIIVVTVLLLLAATSGCDQQTNASSRAATTPPVGSNCSVQFRRDLLGATMDLPISPMTSSIDGAQVNVHGTLVDINAEWVILDRSGTTLWIPRENVLLLSF